MFTGLVIGGILLIAALLVFAGWCCYRYGRDVGYDQGLNDGKRQLADDQEAERKAARRKTGRHASVQPRRAPDRTTLVQDDPSEPDGGWSAFPTEPERITWPRDEAVGGPIEIPGKAAAERMRQRAATVNVVLPEPGTYLPQPGRDSGPGTDTLDKLTTTGELSLYEARTNEFIARMAVDEETHRLETAT